ncbi:hypothetical protein B0H10DRAFT_1830041 [Mycena sp. CBHHK59/15]|nr:hypothetical protein B0H10DRAFT_1841107 [Mycena sp. CBHHK59/15]KAJ6591409.1 hypothetical protein B0H10DRAFT_1830041 [Mycena sp. CBHHK59/15]
MEEFLIKGKLNPVTNSTQNNFLKIFAAWIIEDDLMFTTGETEGINRLFKFLQTCYQLPSNTTGRNTLAQMYIDIQGCEVQDCLSEDTWTTCAMTFTFAGTISSWITSDWELVEHVLDFHPIEDKEHEGNTPPSVSLRRWPNWRCLKR